MYDVATIRAWLSATTERGPNKTAYVRDRGADVLYRLYFAEPRQTAKQIAGEWGTSTALVYHYRKLARRMLRHPTRQKRIPSDALDVLRLDQP